MTKKTVLLTLISALIFGVTACGDDDDNGKGTKDSETESETGTDTGEADAGPHECTGPDVAIDENFDEWDGGGATFYMAKPTADGIVVYDDNNTMVTIADHDALYFHANTEQNGDYGWAIEAQFEFDENIDMSCEDYTISFDVYVPQAVMDMGGHVQWAFYETGGYTPIYSTWYTDSITPDTWVTIDAGVSTTATDPDGGPIVTYSGFPEEDNPSAWQFDVVRVQLVIDDAEAGAAEDVEVEFYIDNLVVKKKDA